MMQKKKNDLINQLNNFSEEEVVIMSKPKKIEKGVFIQHPDFRGSRYRGVSKNKGKWQMTFTLKKKRTYKGGFRTEIDAARQYDRISIKNFGLQGN
mmetsp:Transcript_29147/g.25784  ORF Transcript_29147/g.25784 Transcript_29147/m.25784 type:complete len:96 (-) Transcript_29147:63-350(-)